LTLNSASSNQKKITTKTLCEITGTKYYMHNEEIDLADDRIVRVFDENEVLVGDLKFSDAMAISNTYQKDVVLRNAKTDPPIVKIMNYKMELMKRLFKKLGRNAATTKKDTKGKSMRLTTSVSIHDLENKKRHAIAMLKEVSTLRFFMKVNVYDADNVEKGRMILFNLAEDLKEYARVKVAPAKEKSKGSAEAGEKKPSSISEIKSKAEA
jgi:translation initiation factor IF-3